MMFHNDPLRFREISAGYRKHRVLDGLSLTIPRGSICALLGRNGAGKTTLLRTALGFLKPKAGHIEVLGYDAWKSRYELKDRIGFVAERQDLWPRMRAGELLALASKLFTRWDHDQAQDLVDRYGLPLDRRIGGYSKGMQVQLAQVVALAHNPELLILDEPVSSMDPVIRTEFTEHVLRYVHDTGATVVYSTHLVDEVESLANRVAFLYGGQIILEGSVDEILEQYTRVLIVTGEETKKGVATLKPVAVHRQEGVAAATFASPIATVEGQLKECSIGVLEIRKPSLQELFIALLGEDNPLRNGSHAARSTSEVA